MNFNGAVTLLFATASSVQAAENGLRALSSNSMMGYTESLGQCTGAKCGLWGDPHINSCDAQTYDCQGIGIFTLMKNMAFNVQANFVNVGALEYAHIEKKNWDLPLGASITNDVMIDFLLDYSPRFQFGFGDVAIPHDQNKYVFPGEDECQVDYYYMPPNMVGTKKTREANVELCRERCENTPGCTGFTYWHDAECNIVDHNSVKHKVTNKKWSRVVLGEMDKKCGQHAPDLELIEQEERMKHGYIGKKCPLLMWEDEVMTDLSNNVDDSYLYGKKGDKTTVELLTEKRQQHVEITYTMPNGVDKTVIRLKAMGKGPGKLWSCHWNFDICLPERYKEDFATTTVGLLGTPDGIEDNEWMDPDGIQLPMNVDKDDPGRHQDAMNYCLENWCVSQDESIMAYHGTTTYEDHKCAGEEYDEDYYTCEISRVKAKELCLVMPLQDRDACEKDCCMGGCDDIPIILPDLERHNDTKPEQEESADECDDLVDTPGQVCPSVEGGIVKLLRSTGTASIPEGAEVFHSIVMDPDPDDNASTTVRFKVNNPFDSDAHVYVKHEVNVLTSFTNSVCDGFALDASACDASNEIEVACKEFPGIEPFALVNVYFASVGLDASNDAEIDKCCGADEYGPGTGIVEYTFQIQCKCPDDNTL